MKQKLLTLIVCPLCAADLSLETFELTTASEIQSGFLRCVSCATSYPVIGGIPRLLPPALQSMLWEMHPEFFRAHHARLPPDLQRDADAQRAAPGADDRALSSQLDTAKSFGYEWQAFSEMLPDYEANFRWYFERFKPEDFTGRLVLDAGCGTGRHTFYMSRTGAREVVAMDFSQAIEVAAANNRANQNTHFVQADIYHPPFRPQTFDFVYSLGVLHHLPDPERGFQSLLRYLRPDEFINIYLYWNLEGEAAWKRALLKVVTQARQVTTRMPHAWLQRLSWVLAAGFQVAFVLPARVLASLPPTRPLADRVPLGHYRKYSFRVLYTDQFDRFSAPIENRYSRAEVAGWFERAGLREVVILGGQGWRASGRSAAVGTAQQQGESSAETMQTIAS
ncbi:MAG TPA: methyltransferase domain-containing protein [Pyrinomonadaceae bacterium]|nr:methyltransferase domain-containing protein [Pyrinomonadaceae bacterium]